MDEIEAGCHSFDMGGIVDERPGEPLTPNDCQVVVAYFVPLLPRPLGRGGATPDVDVTDQLAALAGSDQVPGDLTKHELLPVLAVLEPLRLWGYSDCVNSALRESMPHACGGVAFSETELKKMSRPDARNATWMPCLGRLDIWNVGVGLACLAFQLEPNGEASWRDIRQSATSDTVKAAVLESLRATVVSRCEGEVRDSITALWTQTMFIVRATRETDASALASIADALTSGGRALPLNGSSEALSLSAEACAVAGPEARDHGSALGRVVVAQTATWAAAIGMDRDLSALLDSGASEAQRLSLDKLEDRSVQLLAQYEQVQKFRSGVDLVPLHLGDPDRAMWAAVNSVWELNRQLKAMDAKVAAVEHIYGHLADKMAAKQARFLNLVVLGVTCVSLATFIFSIEEFVRKRFDPLSWLSVGVVAAAVLLSLLFYLVVSGFTQRMRVRVRLTARRST